MPRPPLRPNKKHHRMPGSIVPRLAQHPVQPTGDGLGLFGCGLPPAADGSRWAGVRQPSFGYAQDDSRVVQPGLVVGQVSVADPERSRRI